MTGKNIPVRLEPWELVTAAHVGLWRNLTAIRKGHRDRHGYNGDGWAVHIQGAGGEMVVAKLATRYWDGYIGPGSRADILPDLQVRTSQEGGRLIVHFEDPDALVYVHVRGLLPNYTVVGWIYGHEAKRDEWWRDPVGGRPAYFVPEEALHPFPLP